MTLNPLDKSAKLDIPPTAGEARQFPGKIQATNRKPVHLHRVRYLLQNLFRLGFIFRQDRGRNDHPAPPAFADADRHRVAAGRGVLGAAEGVGRGILGGGALLQS